MALRRAVFCDEQGVFEGDDLDAIDPQAQTLVALSQMGGMPDQVVGTVRIHQAEPGLWWGSRLAVHAAFRHHGRIGATLIQLAVASAHARGCRVFLAHVQQQNVPLFERLHWQAMKEETLHGRPHMLMQADLAHYPPCHDPQHGLMTGSGR
jgi:putative N-acetyltransferase (TIGR04045 family)